MVHIPRPRVEVLHDDRLSSPPMIIESGWDLVTLARPRLFSMTVGSAPRAVIVCDVDLRLIDVRFVDRSARPEDVMHEIHEQQAHYEAEGLGEYCRTAFVATVERLPSLPHHDTWEPHQPWLQAIEASGWKSLGQVQLDDDSWRSSGPMYEFKSYGPDYPRALVVRGPHSFECECVVCLDERERIATLRARHVRKNVQ